MREYCLYTLLCCTTCVRERITVQLVRYREFVLQQVRHRMNQNFVSIGVWHLSWLVLPAFSLTKASKQWITDSSGIKSDKSETIDMSLSYLKNNACTADWWQKVNREYPVLQCCLYCGMHTIFHDMLWYYL